MNDRVKIVATIAGVWAALGLFIAGIVLWPNIVGWTALVVCGASILAIVTLVTYSLITDDGPRWRWK